MMKRIATLAVATVGLGAAMSVTGSEPWFGKLRIEKVAVAYGDLDMKTPAGVATLHLRMREAAREVCARDGLTAGGGPGRIMCRGRSIERAVTSAPSELQAYHAQWKAEGADWSAKPESSGAQRLATNRQE